MLSDYKFYFRQMLSFTLDLNFCSVYLCVLGNEGTYHSVVALCTLCVIEQLECLCYCQLLTAALMWRQGFKSLQTVFESSCHAAQLIIDLTDSRFV